MSVVVPPLGGADIAQLLTSTGPVVKAVLLQCRPTNTTTNGNTTTPIEVEEGTKPPAAAATNDNDGGDDDSSSPRRVVLTDMIEEIEIDTTPNKSMVAKTLGGPFTFLGQYEDEGIMLMIRNLPDDLEDVVRNEMEDEDEDDDKSAASSSSISLSQELPRHFKISQLKALCHERDIDTEEMLEKADLVKALIDYQANTLPPYNPHQLQPPLHKAHVRGDILCLKVAETAEELDEEEPEVEADDDDDGKPSAGGDGAAAVTEQNGDLAVDDDEVDDDQEEPVAAAAKKVVVMANDDFFLDYTKKEYIDFASRTDIPEHELPGLEATEEEEEEEEDDDEDFDPEGPEGAAFMPGDDEELDEEDKNAMFNLVMNEVLRQYREDNGRGPNTRELLELRESIAKELDVKVAKVPEADWDKKAKATPSPSTKKIAFQKEDKVKEFVPHEDEYNYGGEPDAMAMALAMEGDDDDEEEDDEDYSEPPPSKKLKTAGEEEVLDSKPAAIAPAENGPR